ncbi:MAG: ATP-binding protein [Clostridia bacterium]|nr:ATP-binding protein [Clostridia bacterium]
MNTANVHKPYLRLLPVQVAAIMAGAVNSLVDTVMTAHFLGPDAVAGIGFFCPVLTVIYLCYVVLNGTQILCGRAIGSGKSNDAVSLFSTALATVLGYGILLSLGALLLRAQLAALLGAKGNALACLKDYIIGFMPGVPFMILSCSMMMFMPCNNDLKRSYVIMGIMVASNAVLNLVLIRAAGMGMTGLGLASSLSYLFSAALMFPRFLRSDRVYRFSPRSLCFSRMKEAARLGLPELLFNAGVTLRTYLLNLTVMGALGASGVAALNVEFSLLSFLSAIPCGVSRSCTLLGSIYYGERDRQSLTEVTSFALKCGLILSVSMTAAVMAFSARIASAFFLSGTDAWLMTRQMLLCFASIFVWNTLFTVLLRIYQIQDHLLAVNILNFAEQALYGLLAVVGIRLIGAAGVWVANPLADILCLIAIFAWIRIKLKHIPRTLEQWMLLPQDFGARPEDVLEFTVGGMEDVVNVSRTLMDFCRERNVPLRYRTIVGLSVEEMAGNVIQHGSDRSGKSTVEIRLVAEDTLVIRLRDNCRAFDPKQRVGQFDPEDPAKNAGIRMIARLADEMDYHNDAGINTLLIRISP